jgi:hypothetical protein
VRAIRITRELDNLLKEEAREKRVTLNAFMQGLLAKYFEWDKYAEKFKFVEIPHELFIELVEAGDEGRVLGICRKQGILVKEAIMFWFKQVTLDTFLQYAALLMKYSLGTLADYDFKLEGKNAVMTIHHQFGAKYSRGATELLRTAVKDCLEVDPKFETTENQIVIRFTMP